MRLRFRIPILAATVATAVVIGALTTAGTPKSVSAKTQRHSWISMKEYQRAKSTSGLVFVSNVFNPSFDGEGAVNIYPADHPDKPIGQIQGNIRWPSVMTVDKHGDVFVYNTQDALIYEYKPPYNGPPLRTLRYLGCCLSGNAFSTDANDTLYASGDFGTGAITTFTKDATFSTPQVNAYLPIAPNSVVPDGKGNLYGTYNGSGASGVYEYTPSSGVLRNLMISLTGTAAYLLFDRVGNLVVANTAAAEINIYPPGKTTPSKTINAGFHYPSQMAFNRNKTVLYVTDYDPDTSTGVVKALNYPAGTTRWKLPFAYAAGVTAYPATIP